MLETARGLEALHLDDIAHLSLHPENVLLDVNLSVKLSDFGRTSEQIGALLKAEASPYLASELDSDRRAYTAPEVFKAFGLMPKKRPAGLARRRGSVEASAAAEADEPWPSDVWSLGCLIVRVASGASLFSSGSLDGTEASGRAWKELLRDILARDACLADVLHVTGHDRHCPPTVKSMVERCLDLQPAARPSIAEVISALLAPERERSTSRRGRALRTTEASQSAPDGPETSRGDSLGSAFKRASVREEFELDGPADTEASAGECVASSSRSQMPAETSRGDSLGSAFERPSVRKELELEASSDVQRSNGASNGDVEAGGARDIPDTAASSRRSHAGAAAPTRLPPMQREEPLDTAPPPAAEAEERPSHAGAAAPAR